MAKIPEGAKPTFDPEAEGDNLALEQAGDTIRGEAAEVTDFDSLRLDDLSRVDENLIRAKENDPFVNYKPKPEARLSNPGGKTFLMVSPTYVVVYVGPARKDPAMGNQADHSISVLSFRDENGNRTERTIVTGAIFDRRVKVDGKEFQAAVIRDHSVRAEVVWKKGKKGGVVSNEHYRLLDQGQAALLRREFLINHRETEAVKRVMEERDE